MLLFFSCLYLDITKVVSLLLSKLPPSRAIIVALIVFVAQLLVSNFS